MISYDVYRLYIEILCMNRRIIKSSYNYSAVNSVMVGSVWLKTLHLEETIIINLWPK